jgi:hypothetical protein
LKIKITKEQKARSTGTKKVCFNCDQLKSLSAFHKNPTTSDGYVNRCKECTPRKVYVSKPCKGCGGIKDLGEGSWLCSLCTKDPLHRTLILKKICKHGHRFSETGFFLQADRFRCAQCVKIRRQDRWNDPVKKEKSRKDGRRTRLLREYGLSEADWLQIFNSQGGLCQICFKKLKIDIDDEGESAAVDHCHTTGLIRGLICRFPCNYMLGRFKDSATLFRACADYIDNPPATKAFGEPRFTAPGKTGTKKRAKLLKKAKDLQELRRAADYLEHPPAQRVLGKKGAKK